MRANALRHRLFPRKATSRKVHLGPGQGNYLDGWINVDANFVTAKIDIWADVRGRLPFRNETLDAIYSHHMIEHLPDLLLPFHFSEMFRTLRPGWVIRIAGPNGDGAAKKFLDGDLAWFGEFPDTRRSIGGRFANFILCRGEHLTTLTATYLAELAENAGFHGIRVCRPAEETGYPTIFDTAVLGNEWESTPEVPHTLVLEAEKPLTEHVEHNP